MIEERPEVVTPDGEVISKEQVEFAYSREGRRVVGREFPNPVPMEPPIGFVPSVPLHEQIRAMVVREMSLAAQAEGFETAEEADDFEVGDDFDPTTPYEMDFEPTAPWPARPEVEEAERAAVSAGGGGAQPPGDEQNPPAKPAPGEPT